MDGWHANILSSKGAFAKTLGCLSPYPAVPMRTVAFVCLTPSHMLERAHEHRQRFSHAREIDGNTLNQFDIF